MITSARTHTHTVRKPAALANSTTTRTSTSASTTSHSSSLPTTPTSTSPSPNSHYSPSQVGLLTPSSSKVSLTPVHQQYKDQVLLPSPVVTPHKTKHSPPSRYLFFPVRASLELYTHPARGSGVFMPDNTSRPGSPTRRSRALSPTRPELTRPPSRCESLLRNTLRRADQQERSLARRTLSRSPGRWSRGRSRPRGNSFLEALRRDDSADSDCDCDDMSTRRMNGSEGFPWLSRAQAMPMPGRGATSTCSGDAGSLNYGSPSSPTPMPPSMTRIRTAPAVPRVKSRVNDDEHRTGYSHHTRNPTSGRQSLPNTVSHSHVSLSPSNDASPKQRLGTLSPHETVLRSKLEIVLQKAGSPSGEEFAAPSQFAGRERRNHHRALSHGVTVVTSAKVRDGPPGPPSYSSSPQSLAPSSLSNSATDLARSQSAQAQGHSRDSLTYRTTSSSPSEPLTPPPTPPFNARIASEVCKRMDGYVSFANVEGLGEPPGLDIDSDESEDGLKRLGRWFRTLPITFLNGAPGSSTQEAGQLTVTRERAGSH